MYSPTWQGPTSIAGGFPSSLPPFKRRFIPLPPLLSWNTELRLDPVLEPESAPLTRMWDIRTAAYLNAETPLPWLGNPATTPALTSMVIRTSHLAFNLKEIPMVVFPAAGGGPVTIKDILDNVHAAAALITSTPPTAGLFMWAGLEASKYETQEWVLKLI